MPDSSVEAPAAPNSAAVFFQVFPSLMLPMFLGVVDQTIVATALPAISGALGDVERISWIVVAYLITNTVAAPVYGRLGDALGRKRMMMVALGVMIVASGLCAAATSLLMLILARVVQGIGGGGLMTLSQSMIGEAVPPRERARYQGYLAAVVVTSNSFGWRSIFLINIPLGLAAMALVRRLPTRPPSGEAGRFDFAGLALFALVVVPALLALEQVQQMRLGNLPLLAGLVLLSVLCLLLLLRREGMADQPLLPIRLFRQAAIWRSDALAACHGAALVSLITFVPVYLRVVRGASASETGYILLPIAIGIGAGSLITGRLVSKTGRTALFPSLALLPAAALTLLLPFWLPVLSLDTLAGLLAVLAVLMGSVMGVVQVVVQTTAGPTMLGSAAGSVQFSRAMGAAFGTAMVATVLFAVLAAGDPAARGYFGGLVEQGPVSLSGLDPAARQVVLEAAVTAFHYAFLLIGVFVSLAAALAWSIPLRRL